MTHHHPSCPTHIGAPCIGCAPTTSQPDDAEGRGKRPAASTTARWLALIGGVTALWLAFLAALIART